MDGNMHLIWSFIQAVFWVVVIGCFSYVFLTHYILWLELRLSTLAGVQANTPWFALVKSFCIEFLCTLFNAFMYPFRSKVLESTTLTAERHTLAPILFVHGYLHNQIAWYWFTHQLQKKSGVGPIYTINLSPPFASIAELAKLLENKIKEIKAETGASQVILIGHSMGGLVNSYFCEHLAKPSEVAKIIAIGSPFRGTKVAALGYGKNAKEMAPNSAFLLDLFENIRLSQVPYYSIASKFDNIVIPWESAILEGSTHNHLIIDDQGHLRLLISPLVIEQVWKWIIT